MTSNPFALASEKHDKLAAISGKTELVGGGMEEVWWEGKKGMERDGGYMVEGKKGVWAEG